MYKFELELIMLNNKIEREQIKLFVLFMQEKETREQEKVIIELERELKNFKKVNHLL